jgi:hypothetical protein
VGRTPIISCHFHGVFDTRNTVSSRHKMIESEESEMELAGSFHITLFKYF